MGQDNNLPAENVHNTMSGTLGQWIANNEKSMRVSTQIHTQNMEHDNNSPTENVHNTTSGTFGQWI